MENLKIRAATATTPIDGIMAVEALGSYGDKAIPKLFDIIDKTITDQSIKRAATSEIQKIRRGIKP